MINLYNIDCMDFMRGLPDKAYELAIVDPPYGINAPNMQMGNNAPSRNGKASVAVRLRKGRLNSGSGQLKDRLLNKSVIDWDCEAPTKEYFDQLRRISLNQIIWGGNYFTDKLPVSRGWICWDKCQPWENFSQFELAWTSFDMPAQMYIQSNTGGNPEKMDKIHPTQKPVGLYKYCLSYASPGDTFLDTHGGSMSIAIACYDLGFSLDLCELDPDYFAAGKQRLDDHIAKYAPADTKPINNKGQLKIF